METAGNSVSHNLNPTFDLALSGGGFRAAFFQIGALIALGALDRLQHVRRISAVSGGAFAALLYAEKFHEFGNSALPRNSGNGRGTHAAVAAYTALSSISAKDPRTSALLDTSFLLNSLDKKTFFLGRSVERQFNWKGGYFSALPFEVILNTVKLENFELVRHKLADTDNVGNWLAAATALPGVFEPRGIDGTHYVDAGVMDKTAIQSLVDHAAATSQPAQILCIDASQGMAYDTAKAVSAGFGMQKLLEFSAEERRRGLIGRKDVDVVSLRDSSPYWRGVRDSTRKLLADIRTDLDYFTPVEAAALTYTGYYGTLKKLQPALDPQQALTALKAHCEHSPQTRALKRALNQLIDMGEAMTVSDVGGESLETVLAMSKRLMFRQMTSDNSFLRTLGWFYAIWLTACAASVALIIATVWLLTLAWLLSKSWPTLDWRLAVGGGYLATCIPIYCVQIRRGESRAAPLTRLLAFLLCPALWCVVSSLRIGRAAATASPSIGSLRHRQRPSGWLAELFSWPDPDRAPGGSPLTRRLNIVVYFSLSAFLAIFLFVNPVRAGVHLHVFQANPTLQFLAGSWLGHYSRIIGWANPIAIVFALCEIYMRTREWVNAFASRKASIGQPAGRP